MAIQSEVGFFDEARAIFAPVTLISRDWQWELQRGAARGDTRNQIGHRQECLCHMETLGKTVTEHLTQYYFQGARIADRTVLLRGERAGMRVSVWFMYPLLSFNCTI
jgi:hypothetical protein